MADRFFWVLLAVVIVAAGLTVWLARLAAGQAFGQAGLVAIPVLLLVALVLRGLARRS